MLGPPKALPEMVGALEVEGDRGSALAKGSGRGGGGTQVPAASILLGLLPILLLVLLLLLVLDLVVGLVPELVPDLVPGLDVRIGVDLPIQLLVELVQEGRGVI